MTAKPGDSESGLDYSGRDLEALAELPNYHAWILETFQPWLRGRVLEVGAGTGTFSSCYVQAATEAVLVEPAHNLFSLLTARFTGKPHVRPVCGFLNDVCQQRREDFLHGSFDAAVLVNVLEHIEDDLETLCLLEGLLGPQGTLLLFVPALPWLYGSLDAEVDHVQRYSRSRLERTVKRAGFDIVELRYFDVLGVAPWLLTARVLRVRHFNPAMAKFYDAVVVPLGRRLERHVTLPLGKNLICVARPRVAATVPVRLPDWTAPVKRAA